MSLEKIWSIWLITMIRGPIYYSAVSELDSVYLWVCLHQAFDEYVFGLSTVQSQVEQIQGRFEDISFVESTLQMLYLIRNALKKI